MAQSERARDQSYEMLLVDESSTRNTYYEALSVKEDASYDEIRASYRTLLLDSHPDKMQAREPDASEPPSGLRERFLCVQKAWEVLRDTKSRANYDQELRAYRREAEAEAEADEVKLGEMAVGSSDGIEEFLYQCRCGDYFSVTSLEIEEMGICLDGHGGMKAQGSTNFGPASVLLPCGSCSLKIRLIVDVSC